MSEEKKRPASKNWTSMETTALSKGYLQAALDPIKGVEQKSDAWTSVMHYYGLECAKTGLSMRTLEQAKTKWRNIYKVCSKWKAVCSQVRMSSGDDDESLLAKRQQAFQMEEKKKKIAALQREGRIVPNRIRTSPFVFYEAYAALQKDPTFNERLVEESTSFNLQNVDETKPRGRDFQKKMMKMQSFGSQGSSISSVYSTPDILKLKSKPLKMKFSGSALKKEKKEKKEIEESFKKASRIIADEERIKGLQNEMRESYATS